MYYFYGSKPDFNYHSFYRFILKRWVRLSPAFYVATIVYALVSKFIYHNQVDIIFNFFHSVFYCNYIFNQYNTATHFWTLTVEWQFYFLIPFLLIWQNKIGFKNAFLLIFGTLFLITLISVFILNNNFDFLSYTILYRGIEFACGILAARILIRQVAIQRNRKLLGVAFVVVVFCGRILVSQRVFSLSADYYNFFRLFGFTFMGIGFAGILFLSVTSANWAYYILGNPLFKKVGRVSYSFYLFHALVIPLIAALNIKYLPFSDSFAAPVITTVISAVIIYPIALLSFNFLEKPFLSVGNLTTK